MFPYGKQYIDDEDIQSVLDVLRSDWLTTGPSVREFEREFAEYTGSTHAAAVCNGTAALHCAAYVMGVGPGDEVIVPPLTFAATANCICYQGGTPVFVDVDPDTGLIDPEMVEKKITPKSKAIIGVDFAGQPCDWDSLKYIADRHGLLLVADACHALGAEYKGEKAGSLADLSTFSFHPVKHITTGEGGMVTTDNPDFANRIRSFRNHGIDTDFHQREKLGSWYYEMTDLGYNYRITDFQCALGRSQLKKISSFVAKRREIASKYNIFFSEYQYVSPLQIDSNCYHAYHLYPVRVDFLSIGYNRKTFFGLLRDAGIGVNVHYIPVHYHPFYRKQFGTGPGLCPCAESLYEQLVSLPMYPQMTEDEFSQIKETLKKFFR